MRIRHPLDPPGRLPGTLDSHEVMQEADRSRGTKKAPSRDSAFRARQRRGIPAGYAEGRDDRGHPWVRMLGIRSISLSHLYDNGIRLTHRAGCRAKQRVNGVRRVRKSAGVDREPGHGLHESAVDPDLEVEVVGGRAAGAADVADQLPGGRPSAPPAPDASRRSCGRRWSAHAAHRRHCRASRQRRSRRCSLRKHGRRRRRPHRSAYRPGRACRRRCAHTAHRAADVPRTHGKRIAHLTGTRRGERVARGVEAGGGGPCGGSSGGCTCCGRLFRLLLLLDLLGGGRAEGAASEGCRSGLRSDDERLRVDGRELLNSRRRGFARLRRGEGGQRDSGDQCTDGSEDGDGSEWLDGLASTHARAPDRRAGTRSSDVFFAGGSMSAAKTWSSWALALFGSALARRHSALVARM